MVIVVVQNSSIWLIIVGFCSLLVMYLFHSYNYYIKLNLPIATFFLSLMEKIIIQSFISPSLGTVCWFESHKKLPKYMTKLIHMQTNFYQC